MKTVIFSIQKDVVVSLLRTYLEGCIVLGKHLYPISAATTIHKIIQEYKKNGKVTMWPYDGV